MFGPGMSIEAFDPRLAAAIASESRRQEEHLELIASENYASPRVLEAQGSVLTNKYAEGYPGKRYYGGCEFVDVAEELAIERAKAAVRRRVRQRTAALRLPGERGCLFRAARPGRHAARDEPRPRRPSDPRREGELLRQGLQRRPVRPRCRDRRDRLRAGRAPRARAPAEDDPRRILGLFARDRLAAIPRDRRCRRRLVRGRHGARRRPRRGRRLPEPGAGRRRRHDDDAQDAARSARRADPRARAPGPAQEAQLHRVPGPAGRPAHARDRGQGGGPARGARARVQGVPAAGGRECARDGDRAAGPRLPHRVGRHGQSPVPARPDRQGVHGQGCRRGARPRAHHGQQERGAERSAPAVRDQRPAHRHAGDHDPRIRRVGIAAGRQLDCRRARRHGRRGGRRCACARPVQSICGRFPVYA